MIYITGDKHGNFQAYYQLIENNNFQKDDVIIVCGDAGLEYGSYNMGSCKKEMKKCDATWLILRGNHDIRYWRRHFSNSDNWSVSYRFKEATLVQNKYPNIHYLLDEGGIYTINGYNFLMIPGAYSVDKDYRLQNHLPYEFDEQLNIDERLSLKSIIRPNEIDFVCAHTFPCSQISNLKYLFLSFIDQSKVDNTMEYFIEDLMIDIEKSPRFKHYFGGHYHDDKQIDKQYTIVFDKAVKVEDYIG